MSDTLPLVSIITVCLNSGKTIRRTIESVFGQSYPKIEYAIIDGSSTDETLDIVHEYQDRLAVVVSEPDRGISDAFNKGIRLTKGDLVQFLNADDYLGNSTVENSVYVLRENSRAAFVFSDIVKLGTTTRKPDPFLGDPGYARSISYVMPRLNHPTILARRNLFDRYGGFDLRWQIAMDYDWLLRLHENGERGVYSPKSVDFMEGGGLSDAQAFEAFKEVRDISIAHGLSRTIAFPYYVARCAKQALFTALGLR